MILQRYKLLSVAYSSSNRNELYKYNFEGGVSVIRNYVSPFTRLNSKISVFKIPFFELRFFIQELIGICITVVIGVIMLVSMHKSINVNKFALTDILLSCIKFVVFMALSSYIFTKLIAEIFTFYYGKHVVGTIVGKEEYRNAGNERAAHYRVEIPDGVEIFLDDFTPELFDIGEYVNLKIHPDYIPFVVFRNGFFTAFLFMLVYAALIYECIKSIL